MSTRTAPVDQLTDRPVHIVCCDPDTALCGADLTGRPYEPDDTEVTCRLCDIADAEDLPCRMCQDGAW